MLLDCDDCGARVQAIEIGYYDFAEDDSPFPIKYTFARCPECWSPMVAIQEDYGGGWDKPGRIFPTQRKASRSVPEPIRASFDETLACFAGRTYTATAIMCRRTVEGVCMHHGAPKGTLEKQLKWLQTQGIIEQGLFDWADMLRLAGNDAAHNVDVTLSQNDARDLVDFADAHLQYVFTFKDQFKAYKQRRADQGKE
jgi:hypothetical protein